MPKLLPHLDALTTHAPKLLPHTRKLTKCARSGQYPSD